VKPLYPQESLRGITLLAVTRLGAPTFVFAFAVLVALARLEDFYPQIGHVRIVGWWGYAKNEDLEFN